MLQHCPGRPVALPQNNGAWSGPRCIQGSDSMKIHDRRWIAVGPSAASAHLWAGDGYPTLESNPYQGKWSASSTISRSRVTLATTEAAAMASEVASPLTIVRQR